LCYKVNCYHHTNAYQQIPLPIRCRLPEIPLPAGSLAHHQGTDLPKIFTFEGAIFEREIEFSLLSGKSDIRVAVLSQFGGQ
jgi:hypothetical protein